MPKNNTAKDRYVLGFDGGGTKSIAVISKEDGEVVGVGKSGVTNFQGAGTVAAGIEIKRAINQAIKQSGIKRSQISTAAYGIAGADRDEDFDIVAGYMLPHNPAGRIMLVNDTTIALRAGTTDGVGVAVICGTGSNCIGFNNELKQAKVGGYGELSGDAGGGESLVTRAFVACMMAKDGRGPKTMLDQKLCEALEIKQIEDVIAFTYADSYNPPNFSELAPVVCKCAQKGDKVAIKVLRTMGKELAFSGLTACKRLFKKDDKFPLVLGGSLLQAAKPGIMADTIKEQIGKKYPNSRVIKLKVEPVLGAVFYALDLYHGKAGRNRMAKVKRTYPDFAVR